MNGTEFGDIVNGMICATIEGYPQVKNGMIRSNMVMQRNCNNTRLPDNREILGEVR